MQVNGKLRDRLTLRARRARSRRARGGAGERQSGAAAPGQGDRAGDLCAEPAVELRRQAVEVWCTGCWSLVDTGHSVRWRVPCTIQRKHSGHPRPRQGRCAPCTPAWPGRRDQAPVPRHAASELVLAEGRLIRARGRRSPQARNTRRKCAHRRISRRRDRARRAEFASIFYSGTLRTASPSTQPERYPDLCPPSLFPPKRLPDLRDGASGMDSSAVSSAPSPRSSTPSARMARARGSSTRRPASPACTRRCSTGLRIDPKEYLKVTFEAEQDEMVILRDIPFYSVCEHHFMPFPWHRRRRLHPGRPGRRREQAGPPRRGLRAAAAAPGAAHRADRGRVDGV